MRIRSGLLSTVLVLSVVGRVSAGDAWFLTPASQEPASASGGQVVAEFPPGPPSGFQLDLAAPAAAQPAAPARAALTSLETGTDKPSHDRQARSGLRVKAGVGFSAPDHPPVSITADVVGHDPSESVPITVTGKRQFGTQADMRTPKREVGIGIVYTLPSAAGPQVTFDSRFDVIRHGETEKPETQGTAAIRVNF